VAAVTLFALPGSSGAAPSVDGQWSPLQQWPISATHTTLLPTGKLLVIGEFEEGDLPPLLWDPATGAITETAPPAYNVFCAGHSYLPDGRLLFTGGHMESHMGFPHASVFDPLSSSWTQTPDMNDNRWYPTNTTLPNGDIVVVSGETTGSGVINPLPQVYSAVTGTWRDLTNALFNLPYYPRQFVTPEGRVLVVNPRRATRYLDTEGAGAWIAGPLSQCCTRTYGPAVLRDGKIYLIGGGDPPTATVEVFDLGAEGSAWTYRAPMSVPRRQHNAVFLPDGTVLVVGGSQAPGFNEESGAVFHAEVYDPDSNTWTTLASMADFHGYHATALLLPDGRVFMGGGRNKHGVEIFSPPYLFRGPRPTVTAVPPSLTPGDLFPIDTPDVSRIRKVSLINLGTVTHAFDEGSRFITLPFTRTSGRLEARAPESNNLVPPGPYQLFVVDDMGIPSLGRMVNVTVKPPGMAKAIVLGDTWKYNDLGVDPGPTWMNPSYDDSTWASGPGQLGYGDLDQATTLTRRSPTQPSYYFRKKVTFSQQVTAAEIEVVHDDGVAVWVNGVLVFSYGMGNGTGYPTWATVSVDNKLSRFALNLTQAPLVVGENTIAVMVKQVSSSSGDLSFALQLAVSHTPGPDGVVLYAPNGGERLSAGTTTDVLWMTTGQPRATMDLHLSLDAGGSWTPIALGVPNTGRYIWTVPNLPSDLALVRVSSGSPPPAVSDTSNAPFSITGTTTYTAIPFGSSWRYRDSGQDPGASWSTPGYDDSAWPSGPGELGYGDSDEATVLLRTVPSQTSVYFRKLIDVPGPVTTADVKVRFDDGVAIYVNGALALVRNMNSGLGHAKYASATEENRLEAAPLSPALFTEGNNVVAVMVKQVGATSPDLSFDLELTLQTGLAPDPSRHQIPATPPVPPRPLP